jgi:hypothetical protein
MSCMSLYRLLLLRVEIGSGENENRAHSTQVTVYRETEPVTQHRYDLPLTDLYTATADYVSAADEVQS